MQGKNTNVQFLEVIIYHKIRSIEGIVRTTEEIFVIFEIEILCVGILYYCVSILFSTFF